MPEQTLAQAIKAKYPGKYDAWSDAALETSIKEKFPGKYDAWPTTQSIEAKPSEQPPIPGVGSERRVIEPSLTRTPGQAAWEGFKSGALEGGKELLQGASAGLNQLVASPVYNAAVALGFHPDKASYESQTTVPSTLSGRIGGALPMTGAVLTGAAELGWIPTLAGLATGAAAGKGAQTATDYALPTDMDPERRAAIVELANLAGMTAGGVAGTAGMRSPMGQRAIAGVTNAAQGSLQERAAAASLGALAGYEVAGPKAAAAGGAFGAAFPNVVIKRPRAILADWAKGVLTDAAEKPARTPKPEPTLASQRQAEIDAGLKVATEAQAQKALTADDLPKIQRTLEKAQNAHIANGEDVPTPISEQLARVNRELGRAKLPETEAKVNDLMEVYGPTGVAGRVDLVTDATSKKDYASIQRHLASYVNAGEQPPAALVELFDRLREHRIASNKSVSAEAYDVATAQLVDAAAQGPQAYKQALAAIPKQTRALLQNVDASLLSTLESRAKNAGGRLGKPADDPWFTLMNEVLGEWARPQSVEVPVESPGGSFTVPSNVEIRQTPGAAVAVDVSPANRGGRLVPRPVKPSIESAVTAAIEEGRQPSSVSVGPSSPSGSATVPSGVDVVRVPGAAVSVPSKVAEPAAVSAAPATPVELAAAPANSATARAAKRGKSELGYSTQLPRQHDATTLSAAARLLQLAHDFTAIREATPQLLKSVVKNPEIDARLAEFERLSRLFAGQDQVKPFATTRNMEHIPNIGRVNGWISNSTNLKLTPRIKQSLGLKD